MPVLCSMIILYNYAVASLNICSIRSESSGDPFCVIDGFSQRKCPTLTVPLMLFAGGHSLAAYLLPLFRLK